MLPLIELIEEKDRQIKHLMAHVQELHHPREIPVTPEMIKAARGAGTRYFNRFTARTITRIYRAMRALEPQK
jgi:hypothetical protein